jgi:hypothetical protein
MERYHYIEDTDQLVQETIYDPEPIIEANKLERLATGTGKLSDNKLVKVASLPLEHIEALKNKGYNLLSSDKEEARRALCYIQENEPVWMTVEGKPFAMWRPKWR